MAASVLLLVPGFPLINAVADMFKGHINTGLARWAIASLLTLATCVGVVMALTIWGLRGWCDRISVSVGAGYDPRRHSCGRLCDGVQRSRAGVTLVCAAWLDRSWFPNDLDDQRVEY